MQFKGVLKISLRALLKNKMRAVLTMLGIIIGVAAVVGMASIGQGSKKAIEQRFSAMGDNKLIVSSGNLSNRGVSSGFGSAQTLIVEDALEAAKQCPSVLYVSPSVSSRYQVTHGNKNWNTSVNGVGAKHKEINKLEMEQGRFFEDGDEKAKSKVCVLGYDAYKGLFDWQNSEDAVGVVIRVRNVPCTVLGVVKAKGSAMGFGSRDDIIYMPYTTVMQRLLGTSSGKQVIRQFDVEAVDAQSTGQAKLEIEELLRTRHQLNPNGSQDDFTVRNMADISESAQQSSQILTILLGSIAAISLLVGGIGIMNIMLVSVTERIREIGIRMAVGAREKDIMMQFLVESMVICFIGGILGVALGILVSKLLPLLPVFSTLTPYVSIQLSLLAFSFSGAVGIFFGYYPARKAAKLDPIQALHYE
jgi:putative ABC transport system permease protein